MSNVEESLRILRLLAQERREARERLRQWRYEHG